MAAANTQQEVLLNLILNAIKSPTVGGAGLATEVTLQAVKTAVEAIDISVDNIELDADQINLNTDTLEALQAAGNLSLISIDGKLTAPLSVTGPLTDTQLRATPVPISALNLDVRDLVFATDKVDVSSSTNIGVILPSGAQVLVSITAIVAGPTSTVGGETSVSFRTSAGFTGTINGIARSASTQYVFESTPGKTLAPIAYEVTAGTIDIDTLT